MSCWRRLRGREREKERAKPDPSPDPSLAGEAATYKVSLSLPLDCRTCNLLLNPCLARRDKEAGKSGRLSVHIYVCMYKMKKKKRINRELSYDVSRLSFQDAGDLLRSPDRTAIHLSAY